MAAFCPSHWTDRNGRTLYLHGRWITHVGGARQLLVYFSVTWQAEHALDALPPGYEVTVSPTNGRPYVRRRAAVPPDAPGP